jgi:hypothetical protein
VPFHITLKSGCSDSQGSCSALNRSDFVIGLSNVFLDKSVLNLSAFEPVDSLILILVEKSKCSGYY